MSVRRSATDWALLLTLAAMWGSAFMFIKLGVATVPPATLVAGRVLISAVILVAVVYAMGLRLPPLARGWRAFFVMAIVGNSVPFYLITWGQQFIDSALAGILISMMPLATVVFAHFWAAGERMTRNRVAGFALGFLGIVLLMGPDAFAGLGGSVTKIVAQLMVLSAALCYAANSVIARRTVRANFLVASAAVMVIASLIMVPAALVLDRPWTLAPSFSSAAAIVWLGVGPTAIATICYFRLISSAGPTFMSLVNYIAPTVAVFCGVTLMGEHPGVEAYTGLALILAGIALSQFRRRTPAAP